MPIGKDTLAIGIFCAWVLSSGCAEELETDAGEQLQKTLTLEILSDYEVSHLVEAVADFTEERDESGIKKGEGRFATASFSGLKPVTDPVFLALERFEEPVVKIVKRVARKKEAGIVTDDLLPIQEKQLIFAGKGFDTQRFEKDSDGKLSVDYHYHVTSLMERPLPPESRDAIDPGDDNLKNNRDMIFHEPMALLNDREFEEKDFLPPAETPSQEEIRLEAVPETQLLMDQSPEYMLALRRDSAIMDLLAEEENLNWKLYHDR